MARVTAAVASRSARNFGNITPRETASTWWLARPIRCIPLATEIGVSIWITRSTAPMSIPSSSVEVATRALSSPALSASSIRCRSSRAIEPWWARAISSPARSLSAVASRSARRRAFTNRIVERCARTSSSRRGCIAGQMLRVSAATPDAAGSPASAAASTRPRHVLDRHLDAQVEGLRSTGVDDRHRPRRPLADAVAPAQEAGDLLERPLRRREPDPLQRLSRQRPGAARATARGARRAWSRRRRGSRRRSPSRPRPGTPARADVSTRNSDSGVVIRMSGGLAQHARAVLRGRVAGADRHHRHGWTASPRRGGDGARCPRAARAGSARRPRRAP